MRRTTRAQSPHAHRIDLPSSRFERLIPKERLYADVVGSGLELIAVQKCTSRGNGPGRSSMECLQWMRQRLILIQLTWYSNVLLCFERNRHGSRGAVDRMGLDQEFESVRIPMRRLVTVTIGFNLAIIESARLGTR